ncbi:hypothetical protein AB1Y20_016153 [Prymnesium parvum]|uniref:RAB6-interacting golgin n=1 Tax=Prymnesium parvum TaxID=97485 RepID=A0AB34K2J0_PRYPA
MGGRRQQPAAAERPLGERTSRRQAADGDPEQAQLSTRIEELEEAVRKAKEDKEETERWCAELKHKRNFERKRADELQLKNEKLEKTLEACGQLFLVAKIERTEIETAASSSRGAGGRGIEGKDSKEASSLSGFVKTNIREFQSA